MREMHARHVVVGAGAMGAASAYHLARRGESVVVVEQFELGHALGSSHGAARITRHSYADPRYAALMPAAFRAWRDLEAGAAESFYIRTGGISLAAPGSDYAGRVVSNLAAIGVPHRRLTGRELRRIHPVFEVPDDTDVVFEPDAGLLSASRAVAAQLDLAREIGGDKTLILDRSPVQRIDLDGDHPTLLLPDLRLTADRLIVTAGAYVSRLFPSLADLLQPTRQAVFYVRPADPRPFSIGRFPIFISMGLGPDDAFYGMPDFLDGGIKVARHGGPPCDPETVARVPTAEDFDVVRTFLCGHLPMLADAPHISAEVCLYTVAPGEDFLLGPWLGRPDVIVASPCSGHGFKFSCLLGAALADLAMFGRTTALGGIGIGWEGIA